MVATHSQVASFSCLSHRSIESAGGHHLSSASSLMMRAKPVRLSSTRSGWKLSPKREMVSKAVAVSDSPALYAKEMERVAAKEALLLAIKDAGGVEALTVGNGNPAAKIEVTEKVLALERLNPTPRPTTSPMLEGPWDFVWAGARSPGLLATRLLLKRLPVQLAKLEGLQLTIFQGSTTAVASLKLLSSIETTFSIHSSLAVEGPVRLKEEYSEATLTTPSVQDETIPAPLKGVYEQLIAASKNLPDTAKQALETGLKVPLRGSFKREVVISYLDEEVLVARDKFGLVDVLVRVGEPAPAVPLDSDLELPGPPEEPEYDS